MYFLQNCKSIYDKIATYTLPDSVNSNTAPVLSPPSRYQPSYNHPRT